MKDWYLTDAVTTGGFENDEFYDWRASFENDVLTSFASTEAKVYGNTPYNRPHKIRMLIQNTTADSYNKMLYRLAMFSIGALQCGDLIEADGRWWLVISLVENNGVYSKGMLYYCNVWVNFTSLKTFETVRYPVVVHNATQYNSGERSSDYMTIVSSQRLIYFPCNDETVLLDNDYRFLIDKNTYHPSVWKIAQIDTEHDNWDGYGLVRCMAVEDELQPTDDVAHMIADNSKWIEKNGKNGGYLHPEYKPQSDGGGWIDI